jgi:hypothetical protein
MNLFMKSTVAFSKCRRYRYLLKRVWDDSKPLIVFAMLNPSTADEEKNDRTVARCIRFAQEWRFGGVIVVNLFAYRTPYPSEMRKVSDPIGAENDAFIKEACAGRVVVAAWGKVDPAEQPRADAVTEILKGIASELCCLKYTKTWQPWHPLYVSGTTTRIPFPRAA